MSHIPCEPVTYICHTDHVSQSPIYVTHTIWASHLYMSHTPCEPVTYISYAYC